MAALVMQKISGKLIVGIILGILATVVFFVIYNMIKNGWII
jgi:hypothetical protein